MKKHIDRQSYTSGSLLTRNVLWNLAGRILPLAVGLISIPLLIRVLGTDGFGLLSISWMIVGYFSLFDIGIGKSLAKVISEELAKNHDAQIPLMAWTGLLLLFMLGVSGGVTAWKAAPEIVGFLNLPKYFQQEALDTLLILAFSVPVVVCASGFRGILSAYQRFDLINKIQVLLGIWMFLGPLIILPFTHSLAVIVSSLALGRIISLGFYFFFSWRVSHISIKFQVQLSSVKPLLSLGGWMTVSNIVGPIMTYMDRFFISAWISVTSVTYYTVPYEIVSKLSIFPQAMMGVFFPAFSSLLVSNRAKAIVLVDQAMAYLFFATFPVVFLITAFAPELLSWWVGSEIALHSALVMQVLAIGVLVNTPAHVALTLIQAEGKANWTAYTHLFELPVYLAALWWASTHFGIIGVAIVWSARVAIDAAVLLFLMSMLLAQPAIRYVKRVLYWLFSAVLCVIIIIDFEELNKILFVIVIMTCFIILACFQFLFSKENIGNHHYGSRWI